MFKRYGTYVKIMTEKVEENCCSVNECQVWETAFILLTPRSSDLAWEVNHSSACQEIVHILWNRKVCYRFHNSPQSVLILRKISQAHVLQLMYLNPLLKFSFHLCLLFPSGLFHLVFPTKTSTNFLSPHACYMSCPSHYPWFNTRIIFREENKSWT